MTDIHLWIDDERPMPEAFTHWVKTSQEAIDFLQSVRDDKESFVQVISFDHDLGYNYEDGHSSLDGGQQDDTSRPVLLWMIENQFWPMIIFVHSYNPIGAQWLMGMAQQYAPPVVQVSRVSLNF